MEFNLFSLPDIKVNEYLTSATEKRESGQKREFYDHFLASVQSLEYIEHTDKPEDDDIIGKKVYLPPKREGIKKTLIFDLDETLIHCNENPSAPCDVKVPIKFTGGEVIEANICIRPFAKEVI